MLGLKLNLVSKRGPDDLTENGRRDLRKFYGTSSVKDNERQDQGECMSRTKIES